MLLVGRKYKHGIADGGGAHLSSFSPPSYLLSSPWHGICCVCVGPGSRVNLLMLISLGLGSRV